MARYSKKPVVIEAVQWTGKFYECDEMPEWLVAAEAGATGCPGSIWRTGDRLRVGTLEGDHTAMPGDWIIQGVKGELYPCKPDIFAATYEPVA